jgi:hypothetical protein
MEGKFAGSPVWVGTGQKVWSLTMITSDVTTVAILLAVIRDFIPWVYLLKIGLAFEKEILDKAQHTKDMTVKSPEFFHTTGSSGQMTQIVYLRYTVTITAAYSSYKATRCDSAEFLANETVLKPRSVVTMEWQEPEGARGIFRERNILLNPSEGWTGIVSWEGNHCLGHIKDWNTCAEILWQRTKKCLCLLRIVNMKVTHIDVTR